MKIKTLRNLSLLFVVALAIFLGLRHQFSTGTNAWPIDRYCPFGGIETLFTYAAYHHFILKTGFSNFILLAVTLILVLISGASFCAWLCPLGAIQEWLAKIGRKIFGKNFSLPQKWDTPLRYLKFVVLALILFFSFTTGKLVFEGYDPYKIFFHFKFETYTAIVILVSFIILSILIERFWCKYLCPFNAVFAFFSYFSPIKIKRNSLTCTNCKICTKTCPMGIPVNNLDTMPEKDCIKCLNCIEKCPQPDTLSLTFGKHPQKQGGTYYEA